MSKYTLQQKNQLFAKIQDYVQQDNLSLQNMVDLHDILISDKPSYSHNKSGTMYMSSKYSDEAFEKIEELVKWIEKQHQSSSLAERGLEIPIITDITDIIDQHEQPKETSMNNNDLTDSTQSTFGKGKVFKNTFGASRYRNQKPTDITKENEVFKRLTKISKKRAVIPIHYQEKQLTSWDNSFNNTRNSHFSNFYASGGMDEDDDEDSIQNVEKEELSGESENDDEVIYEECGDDDDDLDYVDLDDDLVDDHEVSDEE